MRANTHPGEDLRDSEFAVYRPAIKEMLKEAIHIFERERTSRRGRDTGGQRIGSGLSVSRCRAQTHKNS